MFTDLFGGAPHARVFDYLAEELDRDQTITSIARGADVARPTVYKVVDHFLDQDVVEQTRTVGNSRFFQLDVDNPVVRDLLRVGEEPKLEELGEPFPDLEIEAPSGPERRARRRGRKR